MRSGHLHPAESIYAEQVRYLYTFRCVYGGRLLCALVVVGACGASSLRRRLAVGSDRRGTPHAIHYRSFVKRSRLPRKRGVVHVFVWVRGDRVVWGVLARRSIRRDRCRTSSS